MPLPDTTTPAVRASRFTARDKLKCVEREIEQRRRVYARLVDQKRMSQRKADTEIAIMEAIADDYRDAVQKDDLFRGGA